MAAYDPYSAREGQIARQQRMADLLGQQATEPIQQFGYDGIPAPISPFAGLAKGLQAWGSNRKNKAAEKGAADLNAQRGADTQADYSDLAAALARRPTEAVQPVSDETGTVTHPYQRATPGGVNFQDIAQMRTPEGRQAGMADINQGQQFGQQMTLEQMRIAAQQVPSGYQRGGDGALQPMAGGPADPTTLAARAAAENPFYFQDTTLPDGTQQRIAIPRGEVPAGGGVVGSKPFTPTNEQASAGGYANRLAAANAILDKLDVQGTSFWGAVKGAIPGGNYLQSPDYQQYDRAVRDFINAQLRRESGAAIGKAEFDSAEQQYFPQAGDKPETIAAKRQARAQAVANMGTAAGPGYKSAQAPAQAPAAGVPTPGTVQNGYRFKGGDPGKQENWEPAG